MHCTPLPLQYLLRRRLLFYESPIQKGRISWSHCWMSLVAITRTRQCWQNDFSPLTSFTPSHARQIFVISPDFATFIWLSFAGISEKSSHRPRRGLLIAFNGIRSAFRSLPGKRLRKPPSAKQPLRLVKKRKGDPSTQACSQSLSFQFRHRKRSNSRKRTCCSRVYHWCHGKGHHFRTHLVDCICRRGLKVHLPFFLFLQRAIQWRHYVGPLLQGFVRTLLWNAK